MRILFVIRSLEPGGAERQLVNLAIGLHQRGHAVSVATFYPGGALAPALKSAGVPLLDTGKSGRWDLWTLLAGLRRIVTETRPEIIHSYLPVGNILGAWLARRPWRPRLVWGVRAADMDLSHYDRVSRGVYTVERWTASAPDRIIVNSQKGLRHLAHLGYPQDRLTMVPNGIDTDLFTPEGPAEPWRQTAEDVVIGLPARLDPIKDHATFLSAAAVLAAQDPRLRFVCIGGESDPAYARHLRQRTTELGLEKRLLWAGNYTDMPTAYRGLDLACLTSQSEGFPNVIGEAMACGLPMVSTDAGDAAYILGDPSRVVPPGDANALAQTLSRLLSDWPHTRTALAQAARARIVEQFGLDAMLQRTEAILTEVLG